MTYLDELKMNEAIVEDINTTLARNGIDETISMSDVTVTDKTVSDLVKSGAKLSGLITDSLWPSVSSATVYHYTSQSAAESILGSGIFRLANIAKRFNEGEVSTFCKTHNLTGYLELDANGDPKYRHLLMPNTFYASFTDASLTETQEQYFWSTFASNDGVRLKFEIEASNPNFRKLYYEAKSGRPIPVIDQLTKTIRSKYNREFILKGISRLCSFYLSGNDYGKENEYRVLHRTWDVGPQPIGTGVDSYFEVPLDKMTECGYRLSVVEVHACDKPVMPSSYVFSKRQL